MKMMGLALMLIVGGLAAQSPMPREQGTGRPVGAVGAQRPMTFADVMAMKRVSDPQISPGGRWVMFSVTEVSLEKNTKVTNLWVVPLQPTSQRRDTHPDVGRPEHAETSERQITFGMVDQTGGRFSPDGKWILLLSNGGGAETQIWTAKWDEATGAIQKPYPLTSLATGTDGAVWSPDSKRIFVCQQCVSGVLGSG